MGFIESLNHYGVKIPINKTELYKQIELHRSQLEAMGLKCKIKKDFDLFEYEVILNGLISQNLIENAYEMFLNKHYDLLDYLNYEEKQRMFNTDVLEILDQAPSFFDEESQTQIYIPYLEPFVNKRYASDYQILLLRQHREYIRNFKVEHDSPAKMYGENIYRTRFSSLMNVYEDDRHICMYYDTLKSLYIFKKDDHELLNKVIILSEKSNAEIQLDDVKQIALYLEEYQYMDCLEFMKEKGFVSEKIARKIQKKYK